MTVVGESVSRIDVLDKVTGRTVFGADLSFPNMLYARVLRSPFSHARITNVDVKRALRTPGVRIAITGKETASYGLYGMAIKDQPILAVDVVRYIGDPVVAVAAEEEEAAEEALRLVKVDYEELPAVFDPVESINSDTVLVHENLESYEYVSSLANPVPRTNICNRFKLRIGNLEEGFRISDEVFEDVFTTQAQTNCCLEPRMSIAMVDASGRILVWSSTQSVYATLRGLSDLFKIPQSQIRVVAPPLGGGFGTKVYLKAEPIAVVLAQQSLGRPVKFQWTREEEFTVPTMRHPTTIRLKTGVKKNGTLAAQEISIIWDTGAYADNGPMLARNASFSSPGPYKTPHVKVDSYCVYTNKIIGGAIRGFGLPQPTFAVESQLDMIAERLGIDPIEIRLKNVVEDGSISASGQRITHTALKECILEAAEVSKWEDRKRSRGNEPIVRGKGLAVMHKGTLTPTSSSALVRINEDGSVNLFCSTANMGQGTDTAFAQIAAETLGIPFEKIRVISSDTDATPYDRSTTSSRSTFHVGNAIRLASLDAKKEVFAVASKYFEAPPEALVIEKGLVFHIDRPSEELPIEELMNRHFGGVGTILGKGVFHTRGGNLDPDTSQGDVFSAFWMYACVVADVEVDRQTGSVKVLRIVSANDVGKAINPAICQQQVEGGVIMGLGYALLEELVFDKGKILNDNFTDYKIPTFTETPEMVSLLIEKPNPDGPFGAKGIAEESIVAVAPAIANAIYDATGVRIKSLPLTPEKILEGLRRGEDKMP